jgi:cardiolipin synthase
VFVKGENVRVLFGFGASAVEYRGDWRKLRIPSQGFRIHSALLRPMKGSHDSPKLEEHWRQARVVGGEELQRVSALVMDDLVPRVGGHGVYYQSFLADGVLYRDTNGVVRSVELGNAPPNLRIDRRYSSHETVSALADRFQTQLTRAHSGESLFFLILPNPEKYPTCLLLDLYRHRCVWLTPAALYDRTERGFDVSGTVDSLSAFVIEGHGFALLKNPISSAARLVDFGVQTAWRFLRWPLPRSVRPGEIVPNRGSMDLKKWEEWLDRYTGTRQEMGSLDILVDGDRFFPRLRSAIAAATNHVSVDMYNFDKDDVGVDIAEQLREKSCSIPVKVVVDRMGTWAGGVSPPATPLPLDFLPPTSIQSFLRSNSCVGARSFLNPWFSSDHNKMVIVDGTRAWLGGMNLGREYRFEWHDLMVEVRGAVVGSLDEDFRRVYAHAGVLGDLGYLGALLSAKPKRAAAPGDWIPVRLLPTRTGWKPLSTAVLGSIRKAEHHIYVENPYLFDKRVTGELVRARRRGVDVRVILPRVNDFKAGARSNLVTANYLMAHGVRVFFYPGMSHVKALQVDGWSCLGSANLNHLSLRLCRENNIAASDPVFAARLRQELFEADFARSYELQENLGVDWADFLSDLVLESF